MELATMQPNPAWIAAGREDAVDALGTEGLRFRIWGGDWCPDCRSRLPDFAAALEAAGVPPDRIAQYPVETAADGSKTGPMVEEYGVELIPTVVVERRGEELARFVEDEGVPIAEHLRAELAAADARG